MAVGGGGGGGKAKVAKLPPARAAQSNHGCYHRFLSFASLSGHYYPINSFGRL
jgi:hypothetical protein